jgi:Senescence regulator
VVPSRFKNRKASILHEEEEDKSDEEEMLPPHEIVARAHAKESPLTTFSVLEGAGRTLKGRDLRQVRNAVWRKTGFLD